MKLLFNILYIRFIIFLFSTLLFILCAYPYVLEAEPIIYNRVQIEIPVIKEIEVEVNDNDESDIYCSCVKTARELGSEIPYNTDAKDFVANTIPQIGALALFRFSNNVYHVAYVVDIQEEAFYIKQSNKIKCKYSEEWIRWDNPFLIGFWKNTLTE